MLRSDEQLCSTAQATMKTKLTVLTKNRLRVVQGLAPLQTKNPQKESNICLEVEI